MPQAAQTDRAAPGDMIQLPGGMIQRPGGMIQWPGGMIQRPKDMLWLRSRKNSILIIFLWRFPYFSTIMKMTVENQSSGYALSFDKDCRLMKIII